MAEKLEYRNHWEKALAFVLGVTAILWVPLWLVYTSLADEGVKMFNEIVIGVED